VKYTPERVDKIVECLEKGLSVTGTCDMVSIHIDTYYDWLKKYSEFSEVVTQAKATAELKAVQMLLTTPRTARDWLERQRRTEYRPPGVKITLLPAEGSGLEAVEGEPE